jgi:outer membrane protein assembly factor BamA
LSLFAALLWVCLSVAGAVDVPGGEVHIKAVRFSGNGLTSEAVILHYLGLQAGQTLSAEALERRVARGEQRLFATSYFYNVAVHVIEGIEAGDRLLIVEVEEGFRWRFGGGPAYAELGQVNLGGRDARWMARVGYAPVGVSYTERLLGGKPVWVGGSVFFSFDDLIPLPVPETQNGTWRARRGSVEVAFGGWVNPELRLGVVGGTSFLQLTKLEQVPDPTVLGLGHTRGGAPWVVLAKAGPVLELVRVDDAFFPTRGHRVGAYAFQGSGGVTRFVKSEVDARGYLRLHENVSLAVRLAVGLSSDTTPGFEHFVLADAGRVRSAWVPELGGTAFALTSLEVRTLAFRIRQLAKVEVRPTAFVDVAFASDGLADPIKQLVPAAGPALRLFFPEPVFTAFRFEYGFSPVGHQFFFSANAVY